MGFNCGSTLQLHTVASAALAANVAMNTVLAGDRLANRVDMTPLGTQSFEELLEASLCSFSALLLAEDTV